MASLEDLSVDQLLARAKELETLETTVRQLTANPETRKMVQQAMKKLNPNLSIPELDNVSAVQAEIAAEREERLKLERKIQEDDIRRRLETQRSGIMARYKLSDSDLLEVEKLMTDKDNPIPTYDAAARVYLASRESAKPTPSSFAPPTFEMPETEIWGKGIGNPAQLNKIAVNEMFKAWEEISSGKVAGLGAARAN